MQTQLPRSVQEIANVIGRSRALYLVGQLPRTYRRQWRCDLYVPQKLKPDHKLVSLLGWEDASKMVKEFGGLILQPARCDCIARDFKYQAVRQMRDEGMSAKDIAEATGIPARTVRHILAATSPEAGRDEECQSASDIPINPDTQGQRIRKGTSHANTH